MGGIAPAVGSVVAGGQATTGMRSSLRMSEASS
jgi:hypothetical protein